MRKICTWKITYHLWIFILPSQGHALSQIILLPAVLTTKVHHIWTGPSNTNHAKHIEKTLSWLLTCFMEPFAFYYQRCKHFLNVQVASNIFQVGLWGLGFYFSSCKVNIYPSCKAYVNGFANWALYQIIIISSWLFTIGDGVTLHFSRSAVVRPWSKAISTMVLGHWCICLIVFTPYLGVCCAIPADDTYQDIPKTYAATFAAIYIKWIKLRCWLLACCRPMSYRVATQIHFGGSTVFRILLITTCMQNFILSTVIHISKWRMLLRHQKIWLWCHWTYEPSANTLWC